MFSIKLVNFTFISQVKLNKYFSLFIQGHEVWHYTVLTQASGGPFKSIHHRVPCVLEGEESVRVRAALFVP